MSTVKAKTATVAAAAAKPSRRDQVKGERVKGEERVKQECKYKHKRVQAQTHTPTHPPTPTHTDTGTDTGTDKQTLW